MALSSLVHTLLQPRIVGDWLQAACPPPKDSTLTLPAPFQRVTPLSGCVAWRNSVWHALH